MKDIVKAKAFHKSCCLFAADTASAEHGNLLAFQLISVLLDPIRKLAESLRLRIDRALESADGIFIIVARIDNDRIFVGNQGIPVLRGNIGANAFQRIDTIDAHGDDFPLQPHLHAIEWHFACMGIFQLRLAEARNGSDMLDELFNRGWRTGNRSVDPFGSQKQRPLDAVAAAKLGQRLTQAFILRQRRKAIKGGDCKGKLLIGCVFFENLPRN